jgi:hypothetical protein
MAIQQKATTLLSLRASCILAMAFFGTGQPVKAETTYNANCKVLGDGISLISTGEIVLEQRLVNFRPIESNNYQRG